jgi:hypothetical protein
LYEINFMILKNRIIFLICITSLIFVTCAKVGSPTGGRKDVTPPKVVSSQPENYSTGFKGNKIEIVFNEYIILKDISKEFIISPPLKEKSDVRIKNKTIIIDLKNELLENSTYTLNFGKAITDNNEGNPLSNFEFVFSTGKSLDSLSVEGRLLNAFDLQPSKDPLSIMLYKNLEDSIPLKEIPVYIGKTDKNGLFRINNINADTYKIFALKDQNFNFLFDLPNEEIAFIDTFLTLTPEFLRTIPLLRLKADSILIDSLTRSLLKSESLLRYDGLLKSDTLNKVKKDSVNRKYSLPAIFVDMFLFSEESTSQYLANNQRKIPEHLELSFNLPLKNDPEIKPMNFEPADKWYLMETNAARDTFHLWINDTTYIKQDTLKMELGYPALDSMKKIYTRRDTIQFLFRKPPIIKPRKGQEPKVDKTSKLKVSTIINKSILDLNRKIPFTFNFPLDKTDTSLIGLYFIKDSVEHRFPYDIKKDSISFRKIFLNSKWIEKTQYRLEVLPGAFTDIYKNINDTLNLSFKSTEKESYGTLILTVSGIKMPMIIQLLGEKETALQEKFISKDSKQVFEYLSAGKYRLKFIYDLNNNKKWDTGKYLKHIQPERVAYYTGEISIRANWELEVKWEAE